MSTNNYVYAAETKRGFIYRLRNAPYYNGVLIGNIYLCFRSKLLGNGSRFLNLQKGSMLTSKDLTTSKEYSFEPLPNAYINLCEGGKYVRTQGHEEEPLQDTTEVDSSTRD